MKKTTQTKIYSFKNNFIFMWKKHWSFDKIFLFLPILKVPLTVVASLIGILLPKIVLDALTMQINISLLILQISVCAVALCIFSVLSEQVNLKISIHANRFFLLYGFYELASKKLNMDYEAFSSSQGKVSSKKAQNATQGNIRQGIVSFFLSFTDVVVNAFGLFSFLAILVTLNPLIILFLVLSYGIDGLIAMIIEKSIHKMLDEEMAVERKTQYIAHRVALTAYAKDIRIYSLAGWLKAVRENLLNQEISLTKRRERLRFTQLLLEGLLVFLRDGLAYVYLIYRMLNDSSMSIGTFSVYFAAISGFGIWLYNMVTNIDALTRANYCVRDYREFMDISDCTRVKDGVPISTKFDSFTFSIKDVSYRYPQSDQNILENINLEIKAGENLAIVGINGAGKTTLVKLLCGLIRPTSGDIFVNGINIKRIDREEYFKLFSAVFQEVNILPVSIGENITYKKSLDNHAQEKLNKALELSNFGLKIDVLPKGINTRLLKQFNSDGIELSGGEMQKLLLARAVFKNAPVLILDEPTAALDPISENNLYLKYHELTQGKTSLYISHRLSSTRFCDRIILLDNRKIAESGTHQELMSLGGKYAEMFDVSSAYYRKAEETGSNIDEKI